MEELIICFQLDDSEFPMLKEVVGRGRRKKMKEGFFFFWN